MHISKEVEAKSKPENENEEQKTKRLERNVEIKKLNADRYKETNEIIEESGKCCFLNKLPKKSDSLIKLFILKTGRLIKENKINGIILAGDFNFPDIIWEKSENFERIVPWQQKQDSTTEAFIKSVENSGLYQNIDFKTFIKSLKPDTLDLVFTDRVCSEVVQDKFLGNSINAHIGISWKYIIPIKVYRESNSANEDWLRIKEKMDEKFKIMAIAYDDLCKYSAELQSTREKAVNIG